VVLPAAAWRLDHAGERQATRDWMARLAIRAAGPEAPIASLSGGNQQKALLARALRRGRGLLLLDEPTDNLDLHSAEALEEALTSFEGTVIAVTHDRWFARSFDRFLVFGADGRVTEHDAPVWDEPRVRRPR
ncbi:MAG: ATP-binding cassette domain-containing protein, partial [Propionibacteriaceae bacterium]|nr:ATP-binding cassette domain-containing protein [Propionibacteriaceae bacterium]